MERLLVTSLDTLVGSNLALAMADRCEVLGLYDRCELTTPSLRTACWHPDDTSTIGQHIDDWRPQWIVHTGPLSASSWQAPACAIAAEREPAVVARLVEAADRHGCRLTVISSDAVFAGPRMFHDESSPATSPAPAAAQGRAMERVLQRSNALVVRTHAYGFGVDPEESGFAEWAFEALSSHAAPIGHVADGRRHATPILATDLAELLWPAYQAGLHGLYHVAGAERASPHRFIVEMAAALGFCTPEGLTDDARPTPSWQEETSLSSKRARRKLAAATPLLREGLNRFAEQAQNGWRAKWHRDGAPCGPIAVAA